MDIDVKNALDNVRIVFNAVIQKEQENIWNLFAQDIYVFIQKISIKDGVSRFKYFVKVYLDIEIRKEEFSDFKGDDVPESLKLINAKEQNSARVLAAFFTVLGKYYISSKFDKKDISAEKVFELLKQISNYISEGKSEQQKSQEQNDIKELDFSSQTSVNSPKNENKSEPEKVVREPEESLEELLDKLNSLIGLDGVKKEVNQIINLIKVQKKGEEFGAELPPLSLHLVFYGNPGTGKTTVARILGKIYKQLGVLSTGQMIEVDRGGLVAGYVGQTATKTQEEIDKAMGGILFIDEAYTLTHGKGETDFGQEAVDTILKAMEDHRNDFIVIVAGYPDLMKEFVASNPGLKSRFNQFINFEDYTPDELQQIFKLQCKTQNLILDNDCEDYLNLYFEQLYNNRSTDYANGRDVRNYFEKVIRARANRIVKNIENVTQEEYMTIVVSDLEEAAKNKNMF